MRTTTTLSIPHVRDLLEEEEEQELTFLENGQRHVGSSDSHRSLFPRSRPLLGGGSNTRDEIATAALPRVRSAPEAEEPANTPRSERRLLRAIKKGDERAFARLVAQYQDRVYAVCLRMLRRPDEAEDTTQEIFVSLHRGLSNFRGEARLSTWIYKITRNHCLNRLKYLERRCEDSRSHLCDDIAETHSPLSGALPPRPDEHLEAIQLRSLLEKALGRLPEEQRLLVILRDVHGLSYEELVDVSELPLGTVKSRLHRARLSLSSVLQLWRDETPVVLRDQEPLTKAVGDTE